MNLDTYTDTERFLTDGRGSATESILYSAPSLDKLFRLMCPVRALRLGGIVTHIDYGKAGNLISDAF